MQYVLNPFTGKFDAVRSLTELDDRYVNITGDTMTGDLTLPVLYAVTPGISVFNGGLQIKAGKKLIFDGA